MRFWVRELFGWLLVLFGLYVFLCVFSILQPPGPSLLESGPLTVIGIVMFRGGIHLLKVASAARICLYAQAEVSRQQLPTAAHDRRRPLNKVLPLE